MNAERLQVRFKLQASALLQIFLWLSDSHSRLFYINTINNGEISIMQNSYCTELFKHSRVGCFFFFSFLWSVSSETRAHFTDLNRNMRNTFLDFLSRSMLLKESRVQIRRWTSNVPDFRKHLRGSGCLEKSWLRGLEGCRQLEMRYIQLRVI